MTQGLVVCTDKDKLNYSIAKNKIEKSLNSNFFYIGESINIEILSL